MDKYHVRIDDDLALATLTESLIDDDRPYLLTVYDEGHNVTVNIGPRLARQLGDLFSRFKDYEAPERSFPKRAEDLRTGDRFRRLGHDEVHTVHADPTPDFAGFVYIKVAEPGSFIDLPDDELVRVMSPACDGSSMKAAS